MRFEPGSLVPCHGDAHIGNLLPTAEGWLWTDFEDASLMPAHWDMASFVCNLALFGGIEQPTFRYVLEHIDSESDLAAFGFAVTARTLMSTLGNFDFALEGHGNDGDLEVATRQLELAEDFIRQIDSTIGGSGD